MNKYCKLLFLLALVIVGCDEAKSPQDLIQLTNHSGNEIRGQLSPGGNFLVYQFVNDGNSDIWLKDLRSDETKPLLSTEDNESSPAWSPDGKEIAYVLVKDGFYGLRKMSLASGETEELWMQDTLQLSGPDWSPDGQHIVATGQYKNQYYLWALNLRTRELRRLTDNGDEYWGKWAPDGKEIIYYTGRNDSLVTVNFETGEYTYLSEDRYIGFSPDISPQNDAIAFVRPHEASYHLWLGRRDGTAIEILTDEDYNTSPTWGPKGEQIVFSKRKEDEQLYALDVENGDLTKLTMFGINRYPSVSPSGKIAFVAISDSGSYVGIKASLDAPTDIVSDQFVYIGGVEWADDEKGIVLEGTKSGSIEIENGLYFQDLEAGELKELDRARDIRNPEWIHGTREVMYSSSRNSPSGNRQIWKVHVESEVKTKIVDNADDKWASDYNESRVLYTQRLNYSELHVYQVDLETGIRTRLLEEIQLPEEAVWSPDGSQIAFRAMKARQFDLSILDVATGEIRPVSNDVYIESAPQWSSDGQKLIFSMNANDMNIWQLKVDKGILNK